MKLPDIPLSPDERGLAETMEGRLTVASAVPEFLSQIRWARGSLAVQMLRRRGMPPQLTQERTVQSLILVRLLQLAFHEASHVAVTYLLFTEDQHHTEGVVLPGSPHVPPGHSAAMKGHFNPVPLMLDCLIASFLCPETLEPVFEFVHDGFWQRTGGRASPGDWELVKTMKATFDAAARHQGVDFDVEQAEPEARDLLAKHHEIFEEATGLMAGVIADAILRGDTFVPMASLETALEGRFQQGSLAPT